MMIIDVDTNRTVKKWSKGELIGRILWTVCHPLFRLSPRIFWGWRRLLLRLFGAKIGKEAHVYPTVKITIPWNISIGNKSAVGDNAILYALGPINIGDRATISQRAHLCAGTHDISRNDRPLVKAKIIIEDDAWIAADAFIGPNVTIGSLAIIGARAVAMKNIPAKQIAVGNPAKIISNVTDRIKNG